MKQSSTDSELIQRFLAGDAEAVQVLDGWISRYAWPYRRRLAAQWEDLQQDLRLEITDLLKRGRFLGRSSLKTYLYRVISHTCLSQIRSTSRWHWAELEEAEQEPVSMPVERVRQEKSRETRDLLLRVLQQMPEECRQLWKMILHGYSYREMSKMLEVAEGALRVRVSRCRRRATAFRHGLQKSKN